MNRIICRIGKTTAEVAVGVTGELGYSQMSALVDTGSDWCCLEEAQVHQVNENPYNLYEPTPEMTETRLVNIWSH